MAIEWARARFLSRRKAHSAVAAAAYHLRTQLPDHHLGAPTEDWSYLAETRLYYETLLPAGAAAAFYTPETLWNAAEAAERRKDSQVAFELVIALPADPEISHRDRIDMARAFAREHFVDKGLAVQLTIHRPLKVPDGAIPNYHAHLLVTTRRIEGDCLARRKATELQPKVRMIGRRRRVTEAPHLWPLTWREWQDRWFEDHGKALRVDPQGLLPYLHIDQRYRHPDDPRIAENEARRQVNAQHKETLWDIACELSDSIAAIEQARHVLQAEENAHLAELHRGDGADRFFARQLNKAVEDLAKRWEDMGTLRRMLHYVGAIPALSALRDIDIEGLERQQRIMTRMREQRWSIKRKHRQDLVDGVEQKVSALRKQAKTEFAAIRPEAVRELARRNAERQSDTVQSEQEQPVQRTRQRMSPRSR